MSFLLIGAPNPDPEAARRYDAMIAHFGNVETLPDGCVAHIAIETDEGLQVLGVWESEAAERTGHGAEELKAVRRRFGLPPLQSRARWPVHNVRLAEFDAHRGGRLAPAAGDPAPPLGHIGLRVADVRACADWYLSKLGALGFRAWSPSADPGAEPRSIRLRAGALVVELIAKPTSGAVSTVDLPSPGPPATCGGFIVEDGDRIAEQLRAAGVEVSDVQPEPVTGSTQQRLLWDCEGNVFTLSSPERRRT